MGSILSWARSEVPIEPAFDDSKVDLSTRDSDYPESPPLTPQINPYACGLHPSSPPPRGAKKNLRNVSSSSDDAQSYTFERFLMSRNWTFTGLKDEDGHPERSASNFMCLHTIYGQPEYVLFQPIDFKVSNQGCVVMVWNSNEGKRRWTFSGLKWEDVTIRNPSNVESALQVASLTVQAIIYKLQLPIRLIDLPIKRDGQNRIRNESPVSFQTIGRNWIRNTESASSRGYQSDQESLESVSTYELE